MAKKLPLQQFSQELMQSISYIHSQALGLLKKRSDALIQGRITIPQQVALELLNREGSLKMNKIAKSLHTSLPAATGLINRLVRLKLVKRSYNKNDRRVVVIELTPGGRRTTEQTKLARRKILEEMFGGLSSKERQTYLNIINKVKKSLDEKNKKL